jgi:hypothetical protein
MFLNKLPAITTPKPVIFGAGIFLAVFYFWATQPSEEIESKSESLPKRPKI